MTYKIKIYCHIFKVIEDPSCDYRGRSQTAHHLLYDYQLYTERTQLKGIVTKNGDRWPINKNQLVTKYFNTFRICISSIDFKSNQP